MSDLHYKADGSLDMRFSSSKAYVESNNGYSSNFGNYSNNNSSNDLHYRKDGGLDMRYSSSKAYAGSNDENSSNNHNFLSNDNKSIFNNNQYNNNSSNDLHYRKDGGLDMRYSSSKSNNTNNNQYSLHDYSNSSFGYFSSFYNNHRENSNNNFSNDLHYRKDGGLDMRYSSSRAYTGSNDLNSSNNHNFLSNDNKSIFSKNNRYNNNQYNNNSSNNLHYRKDGGLDMRYSSSKAYAAAFNHNYHEKFNNTSYYEPAKNNLHYKKDGTLDMRYKTSKAHADSSKKPHQNNQDKTQTHHRSIRSRNAAFNETLDESIHYRKDGKPDMRYSTSKALSSSKNEPSKRNKTIRRENSVNMHDKEDPSSDELHYKKDGTLDMRYSTSKRAVSSKENQENNKDKNQKHHRSIESRNTSSDEAQHEIIHYRKDGKPDMRYSTSKALYISNDKQTSKSRRARRRGRSVNMLDKEDPSSDKLHYKKDGTLDMRYSTSKRAVSSKENQENNKSQNASSDEAQHEIIHYRKDGKPDMRYSTSKALSISNGKQTSKSRRARRRGRSVNIHDKEDPSSDKLHYKKDGTLDMRYSTSKRAVQSQKRKNIEPPNYENDLVKRKDGYLDMRYKACKEYSALPTDSNGEIIENSPEAILFRNDHSLNQAPLSLDFDFDSIEPVSYSGQNMKIKIVFQTAKHIGRKYLGKMILYHATSKKAADKIMESKQFKPGSSGLFGAAMYFADTKEESIHKAAKLDHNGENALIVAEVDMGTALVIEGPKTDLNLYQVHKFRCNSVLGRKSPKSKWEYVVYAPSRIQPIKKILF